LLTLVAKWWPQPFAPRTYILNSQCWLAFLAKIEEVKDGKPDHYFNPTEVFEYVKNMEQQWIKYDVHFGNKSQ